MRILTRGKLAVLAGGVFMGMQAFSGAVQADSYKAGGLPITDYCPVKSEWLTKPKFPTEVAKSGPKNSSTFCDFYQFSTQAYLYLMSPSDKDKNLRNFQVQSNFPVLETNSDGSPVNSCDETVSAQTLRTSLNKSLSTGQAGGNHSTIYAQDRNVVYYEVRFNKGLCSVSASATEMQKTGQINFPGGTTELKFAWKKLSANEIASNTFVTQSQTIDGSPVTLGLVGMHIAVATKDHPEFVWATYEHKTNTPNCDAQGTQSGTKWLFADANCTAQLPISLGDDNSCKFNQPPNKQNAPTGTPTNICAVYPYGTDSGDANAADNLASIISQNTDLENLLQSKGSSSMKVLNNYFNVGAIWLSHSAQNSGGIGVPNERGSLRLANTVAETDYQSVNLNSNFSSNCFGCHNYLGSEQAVSNNITSASLSHIFADVIVGQGKKIDITASKTIANNNAAKNICDGDGSSNNKGACKSAGSHLKWDGNWTNINPSAGSVCGCVLDQQCFKQSSKYTIYIYLIVAPKKLGA